MKCLVATLLSILLLCGCAAQQIDSNSAIDTGIELTGNVFLDAEQTGKASSGGGVIKVITVEKSAALEAGMDMYLDFLEDRVSPCFAEAYALHFTDGTGVLYYGCDPSNAVYGSMDYSGTMLESWGVICPAEDGTYYYQPYTD